MWNAIWQLYSIKKLMKKTSKQTIGIILLAAAIITTISLIKNRNKKNVDDYDWIMW